MEPRVMGSSEWWGTKGDGQVKGGGGRQLFMTAYNSSGGSKGERRGRVPPSAGDASPRPNFL